MKKSKQDSKPGHQSPEPAPLPSKAGRENAQATSAIGPPGLRVNLGQHLKQVSYPGLC